MHRCYNTLKISSHHHHYLTLPFSKCFQLPHITSQKPNGFYLIPIYTGSGITMGHWSLAAIYKNYNIITGWHIDSTGAGLVNNTIFSTIQRCFSNKRDSFSWIHTSSTPQTEVECGPRTLLSMFTIASENLNSNHSPQNIIDHALHPCPNGYSSIYIRRTITEYTCTMLQKASDSVLHNSNNTQRSRFIRKRQKLPRS